MGGRPDKWTLKKLEELGNELIEFVSKPNVWHISEFEVSKGWRPGFCKDISQRKDSFCLYLEQARAILGNKIVKQAMSKQGADGKIVGKFVPMYLQDVEEYDDRRLEKNEEIKHKFAARNNEELAEIMAKNIKDLHDAKPKTKR